MKLSTCRDYADIIAQLRIANLVWWFLHEGETTETTKQETK